MPDFRQRSNELEMLDAPEIDKSQLFRNLEELEYINEKLGGHKATIKGVMSLLRRIRGNKNFHILDIGCGGGDTMRKIADAAASTGVKVTMIGCDINPHCIEYAKKESIAYANLSYFAADFKDLPALGKKYDLCISSLFCHHLYDDDLTKLISTMDEISEMGFVINDLHRHPLAYNSIKFLAKRFSKSPLVINDAPLSVAKGFSKEELVALCKNAGIQNFKVTWEWAFRYLVVADKNKALM